MSVNSTPEPEPGDRYCVACGSDENTDEKLVSGFLPFLVVSPGTDRIHPARWAYLCTCCLASVLRTCRVGWAGQVAELAVHSPDLGAL